MANPVPFMVVEGGPYGTLHAHMARGNTQLDDLRAGADALVVFQGPQAYVTPSWYATKAEHGKVVPTWNYVMVQARGRPRVIDDALWLRRQIGALTAQQERGRARPWAVEDAPVDYVAGLIRGIAGIEIPIREIAGKWKVSQNRSEADRSGVVAGLRTDGDHAMADAVAGATAP
jgi:transcriptional regulator